MPQFGPGLVAIVHPSPPNFCAHHFVIIQRVSEAQPSHAFRGAYGLPFHQRPFSFIFRSPPEEIPLDVLDLFNDGLWGSQDKDKIHGHGLQYRFHQDESTRKIKSSEGPKTKLFVNFI